MKCKHCGGHDFDTASAASTPLATCRGCGSSVPFPPIGLHMANKYGANCGHVHMEHLTALGFITPKGRKAEMTTKHTAGPWEVLVGPEDRPCCVVVSVRPTGQLPTVCDCGSGDVPKAEREANAAFIVQACNSHDALVEACKRLYGAVLAYGKDNPQYGGWAGLATTLKRAIDKAEGKDA